jgi:hypothetical protein
LWWLSGGGGGGLLRVAAERCKEGRLRDFFGEGCRCWMLFFGDGCRWCWLTFFGGIFGGLDTVVKVGGDFRPSPSGKLTVLKPKKKPVRYCCQCYTVLGVLNLNFICHIYKYFVDKDNR